MTEDDDDAGLLALKQAKIAPSALLKQQKNSPKDYSSNPTLLYCKCVNPLDHISVWNWIFQGVKLQLRTSVDI